MMKEWDDFLSSLNRELGADCLAKWLPKRVRFDAANIYLEAKDSFQISWFEEHIRPRIKGLMNANGRPIKVHLLAEKKERAKPERSFSVFNPDPLDPELTLDHFIPSEKNRVAYHLLLEPSPFNPIYLYGPKGAGKTHLLMGSAQLMRKWGKKVFFIRAETFTEHVVSAIRAGQMQEFRKQIREIDALAIDDIHIFSKKWATQEEFFHTFNTLHTAGKPVLISANCPPSALREVEPRLISRFEWGISLEIGRSDPTQILKKKEEQWKTVLPEPLFEWLLVQFPKDPILPFQSLILRAREAKLTVELAQKLLKDLIEKESENALNFEKIVKTVAAHYGITIEDILGKSQMRSVALPRQMAMYYCREKLKLPYQKIASLFQRDHSTVMSSIKQIQKNLDEKITKPLEFTIQ